MVQLLENLWAKGRIGQSRTSFLIGLNVGKFSFFRRPEISDTFLTENSDPGLCWTEQSANWTWCCGWFGLSTALMFISELSSSTAIPSPLKRKLKRPTDLGRLSRTCRTVCQFFGDRNNQDLPVPPPTRLSLTFHNLAMSHRISILNRANDRSCLQQHNLKTSLIHNLNQKSFCWLKTKIK